MDNLLNEEKFLVRVLDDFGCLLYEQAIGTLYNKDREVAERIINGLIKRQYIIRDKNDENVLMANPNNRKDASLIDAYWAFLPMIKQTCNMGNNILCQNFYPADYPAQIAFMAKKTDYEIMVVNNNSIITLPQFLVRGQIVNDNQEEEMDKILVVDNKNMIEECKKCIDRTERMKSKEINRKKLWFAVLDSVTPQVKKYRYVRFREA